MAAQFAAIRPVRRETGLQDSAAVPGKLGVRVLGPFALDGADLAVLKSRKARRALKVLALAYGAVVSTDRLIDAVWSDSLPADPERDLAVLVSRIRTVVGTERLTRHEHGYALGADWFDRVELELLTRDAAARYANGEVTAARMAAEAALALVRGPLLEDESDAEWVVAPRAAADAIVAEARSIAASAALAAGQPFDAITHGRAALEHDPYDEAAGRTVMTAHVAAGRPSSALAFYGALRSRLADDLGVSPDPETVALHDAILRGEVVPGVHRIPVASIRVLVGRERELDVIDTAYERSRRGSVVLDVVGEVGIGKTALIQAWAERARARGAMVLSGRAAEGVEVALQPIADALAGVSPFGGGDAPPWPLLPGPMATGDALRLGVFDALAGVLGRLASAGGLVVIIDDAHRADPVTLGWLGHLVRRPLERAILVITARTTERDLEMPSTMVLPVGPLSIVATRELVGQERADQLWPGTLGNPLLLVELAATPDGDSLPRTIREAVAARLRRCGDAAATLRAAAVLGPNVDLDLLAGLVGESPIAVLEHLDEGVRHSFLTERDGILSFRHDVVRAAIATDTTSPRRAWLHREAARSLADRPDANPLEVARHAREGGDRELAATGLAAGADIAVARFDLAGAEKLFDDAIALDDSAELRLRRSRLRMSRDDLDGADADAEAALAGSAGARALELRAWAARNRHDMESAIRLGRAGAASATDAATEASCLLAVALAHRGVGDLRAADATMAEAVAAVPPANLGLEAWVGVLRVHQGRPRDALTALQPLIGAEAGGLLSFWVEHVIQMAAHADGHLGHVAEALRLLDRLDVELERRGSNIRYGGLSCTYRSWLLRNIASPAAEEHARAGLALARTPEIRAQSMLDLADTLLHLGRLDDAAAALSTAGEGMKIRWFHNRWRAEQRAGVIAARLHLAGDEASAALDAARSVAAAAADRGDACYETIATLIGARAAILVGDPFDPAVVDAALGARRARRGDGGLVAGRRSGRRVGLGPRQGDRRALGRAPVAGGRCGRRAASARARPPAHVIWATSSITSGRNGPSAATTAVAWLTNSPCRSSPRCSTKRAYCGIPRR